MRGSLGHSRRDEVPWRGDRSRAVRQQMQLPKQSVGVPRDPVLVSIDFPADDMNLTTRPVKNPLQFIDLDRRGRWRRERPVDCSKNLAPSGVLRH